MGETWRLIEDGKADGAWNMAVDTALLESVEKGDSGPLLRLYGWDRPTLTIGRLQKTDSQINHAFLQQNGIPIVKRPTGGRALLHDDEVAYSVVAPSTSRLFGPLRRFYENVTAPLKVALSDCGVRIDPARPGIGPERSASCLASRTRFEITCNGRKITATAQRRLRHSALQHGAVTMTTDIEMTLSCFNWRDEREKEAARRATGGYDEHPPAPAPDSERLRSAIVKAFEMLYGVSFHRSCLTCSEKQIAENVAEQAAESVAAPMAR